MRVRGFLLVEGIIFILMAVLAFFALHSMHRKMIAKQVDVFNESIYQIHANMLTNACNPGKESAFKDYCKKNNIEVVNNRKFYAIVKINENKYEIDANNGGDGYNIIPIN